LNASPSCPKLITADETEMPRSLDRHPVRPRPPPVAPRPHLARQLDRPAKQQQFLGQSGLAGVRVRDDRKGAPRNLLGKGAY
jgi:hypothetical protein